jgi:SAM-dependent methyltransferase
MGLPLIDRCRGRIYDFVHNVDTFRSVSMDDVEVVGKNKQLGVPYSVTMPRSMRMVLKQLKGFDPATTFVDIGCGKGCTLLVASRFPFKKIVGVEFADELCQIAQNNIRHYRGPQACKNISVLRMDATEFCFPDGPLMIYFFNPFHESVMDKVLSNLSRSLEASPRSVTLVCDALYHRDVVLRIFRPLKVERIIGFSIYSNHARSNDARQTMVAL